MRVVIYKIPKKEKVLYNLGLLLCKLFKNKKIGILCEKETIDFVDKTLWTFSTNVFLPHDVAVEDELQNEKQPILISSELKHLNRDILCVLTENDLFFAVDKQNVAHGVNDLIYMTQDDCDILKIKKCSNVDKVDVFEKTQNTWHLVIS